MIMERPDGLRANLLDPVVRFTLDHDAAQLDGDAHVARRYVDDLGGVQRSGRWRRGDEVAVDPIPR